MKAVGYTKEPWTLSDQGAITAWSACGVIAQTPAGIWADSLAKAKAASEIGDNGSCFLVDHFEKMHAEAMANGRLMVKAQKLLEALDKLADRADKVLGDIYEGDTGWYFQLQSAAQEARRVSAEATEGVTS